MSKSAMDSRHDALKRGVTAIFVDRRVPGALQQVYYNILRSFGKKVVEKSTPDGLKISCLSESHSIYVEIWQKRDYDIPGFDFPPGSVIIDIGANQGLFSVYAARRGARVLAFEPSAENLEILRKNVTQNSLRDNVEVYDAAVTGGELEVNLFLGTTRRGDIISGSVSIVDSNRGGAGVANRKVRGIPINSIFSDLGVVHCDFMKIDCEGAEYDLFRALSPENFGRISRISLEFHGGRSAELVARLRTNGFSILQHDGGDSGIIKAERVKEKSTHPKHDI